MRLELERVLVGPPRESPTRRAPDSLRAHSETTEDVRPTRTSSVAATLEALRLLSPSCGREQLRTKRRVSALARLRSPLRCDSNGTVPLRPGVADDALHVLRSWERGTAAFGPYIRVARQP